MKRLIAIGEALIDFIPNEAGRGIGAVESFSPKVGGAPANVCGAFAKLGGSAALVTQLGNDPFGGKILAELRSAGIDCSLVSRTSEANTSLAFVALKETGDREFAFYRNPGADMLLSADKIRREWFDGCFALHFCSVSLGDFPMKEAHRRAVEYAREAGAIISFDPNLRPNLWPDAESMRRAVLEFLPLADVLKVSDEEIGFITGETDIARALPKLLVGNVGLVAYTRGSGGSDAYTRTTEAHAGSPRVKAVDTTGAGDAFIGTLLHSLARAGATAEGLGSLSQEALGAMLSRSNRYCAMSVQKHGAIPSYPTAAEFCE